MNASKSKAEDSAAPEAAPIEKIEKEKSEKTDASTKSPVKKQKVAVAPPASKKAGKKAAVKIEKVEATEMTIQLKQAPGTPAADESTMDLPEPVPVDETPVSESSI